MNFKLDFSRRRLMISNNFVSYLESKMTARSTLLDLDYSPISPSDWSIGFIEHVIDASTVFNDSIVEIKKPMINNHGDEAEPMPIQLEVHANKRISVLSVSKREKSIHNSPILLTKKRNVKSNKKNGDNISENESNPISFNPVFRKSLKTKIVSMKPRPSTEPKKSTHFDMTGFQKRRNLHLEAENQIQRSQLSIKLKEIPRFQNDSSIFIIKSKKIEKSHDSSSVSIWREKFAKQLIKEEQLQSIGKAYLDSPISVHDRTSPKSSSHLILPPSFLKNRENINLRNLLLRNIGQNGHPNDASVSKSKNIKPHASQQLTSNCPAMNKIQLNGLATKIKDKFFIHRLKLSSNRNKNSAVN